MDNIKIDNIYKILTELRTRKNQDYGNSYATFGPVGVFVRLYDKLKRLISIQKNGLMLISSEQFDETIADLVNYGLMYLELSVNDLDEFKKRILK
jgi:uncharacterized Fe-S cluster-containing radical SAM superfamily enzyme